MNERWMVKHAEDLRMAISEFEPYRLDRIVSLNVNFDVIDEGEDTITAVVRAVYWTSSSPELLVELTFHGVRQMRLPELGATRFAFSELRVTEVSDRGLEGVAREARDHGGADNFYVLCREVEATGVYLRNESALTRLWPRSSDGSS